ncbi:MAG: response regulator [Phycisphaeraceae bacterium]|nr:response regulator [Phycisphaeraceae bacterium]
MFNQDAPEFRVLVVEDEPRLRNMLQRAIPDMGMQVAGVASGEEALKHLDENEADLMLVDLNLPGISGLELLAEVRKKHPDIQAVILTGYGDLESAQEAIRLNIADFLTKPCGLGDLEQALERARKKLAEVRALKASPTPATGPKPTPRIDPGADDKPQSSAAGEDADQEGDADSTRQPSTLADYERIHILEALRRNKGNRNETAAELGISVRTLYYRLAEYQKQGLLGEDE